MTPHSSGILLSNPQSFSYQRHSHQFMKQKVHCLAHNSPPPPPILNHITSDCILLHYILQYSFLAAYAKLLEATIGSVMSLRPSIRMEQLGSHWTDFHLWYFRIFSTLRRENLTITTGTSHEDLCTYVTVPGRTLLNMKNVSNVVEKMKTHILCSITPPQKIVPAMR